MSKGEFLSDHSCLDDRSVKVGLLESISEAEFKLVEDVPPRVERRRAAKRLRNRPKLVDPVAMVAVGVGDDDPVKSADIGGKKLLAKVRPAIDQHSFAGAVDQNRTP